MSTTLTIIICVLIADFFTGVFHWLEDSYCLESIPFIGKLVCEPNIKHHEFPSLITKMGGIITHNYQSMLLALFFVLVCYLLGFYTWPILLIAILAGFGNQVHTWNHEPKSSYFVSWLKDSGLIQQQKQHSKHHLPPYDKYYCVLLNFNNAWMERINFWRKLEFVISLFGIKIKRGSEKRNGY
mgnify:CR=1 FL=1